MIENQEFIISQYSYGSLFNILLSISVRVIYKI